MSRPESGGDLRERAAQLWLKLSLRQRESVVLLAQRKKLDEWVGYIRTLESLVRLGVVGHNPGEPYWLTAFGRLLAAEAEPKTVEAPTEVNHG